MEIVQANSRYHHAMCVFVRTIVFIQEYGFSVRGEIDEYEDEAIDFIAYDQNDPIATARYRVDNDNVAIIERVAVIKERRNDGLGKQLMHYVINAIRNDSHVNGIKLSAQDNAIKFYQSNGFMAYGDAYIEEGVSHIMMKYEG